MPFTKNGSIPQSLENFVSHIRKFSNDDQETSNWIEVPDKPVAPEGKEVVWWYPPGWVIRDPKPANEEGFVWKWNQTSEEWIKYALPNLIINVAVESNVSAITSSDISSLSTSQLEMFQ